jgi:hypothetical protein
VRRKGFQAAVFGIFTALALALPAGALALTSTNDVYDPVDARVQQASSAGGGGGGGALPFSGLDIAIVVLAGLAILATGLLIRRASRTD